MIKSAVVNECICVGSVSPKEEPEDQGGGADEDPAQNPADITNPEDYNNIFHPGKTLGNALRRDFVVLCVLLFLYMRACGNFQTFGVSFSFVFQCASL